MCADNSTVCNCTARNDKGRAAPRSRAWRSEGNHTSVLRQSFSTWYCPPLCLTLSVRLFLCLSAFLCPPSSPSVCQSVCLSVCLSVRLSLCLSVCFSVCQSVCVQTVSLSLGLSESLLVGLSVCLSLCLSVCLSLCQPVCLSVSLSAVYYALVSSFSRSSYSGDLNIGTLVATLPGAWRHRVFAATSWPGVSML